MLLPRPVRLVRGLTPRDPRDYPLWTPDPAKYVWEKSTFTVPADVPDERVQLCADGYQRKFRDYLEMKGFIVVEMGRPEEDKTLLAFARTAPDRRAYVIYAKARRREPEVIRVQVRDQDVPLFQKMGYGLA